MPVEASLSGTRLHPISPAALALVGCATLFWAVYPHLTQLNLDTFLDMLENHVWGIRWQWGNSKHPPLYGWLTALWFEVFPRTDFSYRVFAALNIGVTLVIMLAIARRFLTPDQQRAAVMVSLVLPPLGFTAFTYNANSAMLPFWAGTILFYLRTIERRQWFDATALGAMAAAAILSKYFAAVLLFALFGHALCHRQTRAILASRLTLLAAATFCVLVAPHVVWLANNDFTPITFAATGQGDATATILASRQLEFLLAQPVYALPGLAVLGLLRRPGDGAPLFGWRDARCALSTVSGRAVVWAGLLTVPIAMLLALIVRSPLTSNWTVPVFCVVPILLALLLPIKIAERMRRWTIGLSLGFMAIMLAISPIIRGEIIGRAAVNAAVPLAAMAAAAGQLWDSRVERPVAVVSGAGNPAYAASFYLPSQPQLLYGPGFETQPWVTAAELADVGVMVVCTHEGCIDAWRSPKRWRIEPLGSANVPAVSGAGGPESYTVHAWRAVLVPAPQSEREQ
ncbi:MAG: glycosyltransferase family 39 protein [Roseitalea sp.]|jgi:4-amino-4-deoxy-L-arabinose transferase-like glycosyltransferase|nr:glycosyltransferase family 39 protein [Roseitalea sp.]MBO6723717.1 glycosyltransferase family 39 protein [Roseitalea sp.]MBO6744700.1 glycosyltransferase family 39 protein [Roseitalea sp.]